MFNYLLLCANCYHFNTTVGCSNFVYLGFVHIGELWKFVMVISYYGPFVLSRKYKVMLENHDYDAGYVFILKLILYLQAQMVLLGKD